MKNMLFGVSFYGSASSVMNTKGQGKFFSETLREVQHLKHRLQRRTKQDKHYNTLVEKYDAVTAKVTELETKRDLRKGRAENFKMFIRMFQKLQGTLSEFDNDIWLQSIDVVKVKNDGCLTFVFHGGTEIEV